MAGVEVSLVMVGNAAHGMLCSSKKLYQEQSTMNSPMRKQKLGDFLIALTSAIGSEKKIVW
jgi:hypothetical protein